MTDRTEFTACVAGHFPWLETPPAPTFVQPKPIPLTPLQRAARLGGLKRRHPPAAVGKILGCAEVLEVLPSAPGRSDERVRARCTCGRIVVSLVYVIRNRKVCRHAGGK